MPELTYLNLYTTDPAFNLAAEQYVFENMPSDRAYLMLWQNNNAVIIGKYQNAYAEINIPYVREHDIKVVRRMSGGGAVYHDLGNLNFTFIMNAGDLSNLDLHLFCEPVVHALSKLGAEAEINGRNDITLDGKKFSGNAQYLKGGRVMHHGTLMFDSNLSVVANALSVDDEKIKAKGMKSVRSRVTNIKPYLGSHDMDVNEFRKVLLESMLSDNPGEEYLFTETDLEIINKIKAEKYDTWEWNYGSSKEFTEIKKQRFEGCGIIEASISANRGILEEISFSGDFFSLKEPSEIAEKLKGCRMDRDAFYEALSAIDLQEYFLGISKEDFISLLSD